VLCIPFWLIGIFWATFKMEEGLFRAYIAALLLISTFSVAMFVFFPTYIKASSFHGEDIFTSLLRYIHENLGRYDAFPSGHVYISTALALFYSRWYPHLKKWWTSSVVIVALSTLFTGQHYFMDVIGGLVVAFSGYYFGLKWAGIPAIEGDAMGRKMSRPPAR
jgi:membrane-associated phospholipid phosphatase